MFELAAESRLPVWFQLPAGALRPQVSVKMTYYITNSRREAKFELFQERAWLSGRKRIREVRGTQLGDRPNYLPNSGLTGFGKNPSYEIITVGGLTDIVEHRRREPIFYMVDDEEVFRLFKVPPNSALQRAGDT